MAEVQHILDVRVLQRSLDGRALVPGDAEYDTARRCFNAMMIDRRPAVIVRCSGADDVATAFDFAQSHGLEVAVRGGGHNPAGHCVCDGGLVIDVSGLRTVEVDPDARMARSAGGATWLDFDAATQAFGLVTPGGVVGSTGVTGLALGGGIGHLTAQHGLTCDNIVGAVLVTPGGERVEASAHENAELLWGLRGGGGNFGVVTELRFRLHPLERVVGGTLEYRGDRVRDALHCFREVVSEAPRSLSCQAVLSVDEAAEPALLVAPCYTGPYGDPGELRALRAVPGLVEDQVRAQSFLDQQLVFDSAYGENRHYWKGHFVHELSDELIDGLFEQLAAFRHPAAHILIESLHGAPKDADEGLGPVSFRQAAFNVSVMGVWADATEDERHISWTRATAEVLEPWSLGGGYANYMQADEPLERVRASFADRDFERLQALKSKYDPANVLHRNQNIPPL